MSLEELQEAWQHGQPKNQDMEKSKMQLLLEKKAGGTLQKLYRKHHRNLYKSIAFNLLIISLLVILGHYVERTRVDQWLTFAIVASILSSSFCAFLVYWSTNSYDGLESLRKSFEHEREKLNMHFWVTVTSFILGTVVSFVGVGAFWGDFTNLHRPVDELIFSAAISPIIIYAAYRIYKENFKYHFQEIDTMLRQLNNGLQ